MYTLNIIKAIKTKCINEIKDVIFENYYKRIGFSKKSRYSSMKRLNKKDLFLLANELGKSIPDPRNCIEHCKPFIIKEKKSVKQSEMITYQPRTFQNPDIVDIKLFITEHPKISHKLSKTIDKMKK